MTYRTILGGLTAALAVARLLVSTGCGGNPGPSLQAGDAGTQTSDAPIDAPAASAAFPFADTSFGVGGVAHLTHAADWTGSQFIDALLDPDDSIVVVSKNVKTRDSELARVTANGQVDRSFGPSSAGLATSVGHDVYGLTLDGQGKLVVVGTDGTQSKAQRFLPNGTKDSSFNAYVSVGDSFTHASLGNAVTESTGTVLACVSFQTSSGGVIRFGSNGAAQEVGDGGATGKTCPKLPLADGSFLALVNGTVAATGAQTAKVVHLTRDLVLDSNFGPPDTDPTTFSSIQGLAALEGNAFYAVGGRGVRGVSVARYTPAGVLDPTFAAAGIADLSQTLIGNTSVALQSDGKIVVSGASVPKTADSHLGARVVRLLPSGALDPSFGNGGVAEYAPPGTDVDASRVYVQKGGRIVALGTALDAKGIQDVVAIAFRAR